MIRNKTIKFNLDKIEDRELWEWLRTLPHGEFSEGTKEYWEEEMRQSKLRGKSREEIAVDILNNGFSNQGYLTREEKN